jgi:hypothetical protein
VLAILAGLLVLVAASGFAARGLWIATGGTKVVSAPPATQQPAVPPPTAENPGAPATTPVPDPGTAKPGDATLVTDAEARDVVSKFINMRIAGDIAGSKALCSTNMLSGEFGDYVNDKYWKPDSFEITKTTPDQMFIHVTTFGIWPSGREPTIYSVFRDPATGKVVIDGLIFDEP